MTSSKEKKSLAVRQNYSEQLQLFELDASLKDYSNSIELYDTMPKYHLGGSRRKKDDKVESLPIISRVFFHRQKQHKLEILPAAILDKKTGKTIYYYPSQREELVEDVLRKIATQRNRTRQYEDKIGVAFTYYEVQQELIKKGHGYSIVEIKLAIDIMSKAGLVVEDDKKISITSNFFTTVGKEEQELGGKERVVVMFHPLVSRAVNSGNYRLFNYDKLMQMKMSLSRWLHRRISHMFSQATVNNPYEILLSTIVQDSGMKSYNTISERIRQVEKALKELEDTKIISRFDAKADKQKNKILDVLYSIYTSDEFVADAKKANKLTNLRLDNREEEKDTFDVGLLKKEMEKPIYGLTKVYINNHIAKISSYEEYKITLDALEAVSQNKMRGDKIHNMVAYVKKAIKEGWIPAETEDLFDASNVSLEKSKQEILEENKKKQEAHDLLQMNPIWLKIKQKIDKEFDSEVREKWLSELELFSLESSKIVLSAPSKFVRDWIVRELLADIKTSIQSVCPEIKEVSVICMEIVSI